MKVAVLIKSVPDSAADPLLCENGTVSTAGADHVMNPYDEYALEEALRLKERSGAEVIAVSLGADPAVKVLRTALALGADQAVFLREKPGEGSTGRTTARALSAALERFAPDLILAGKQAIDGEGAQVGERVAQNLGFCHASAVSRLQLSSGKIEVDREREGGHDVMEIPLPALVTVEKGINTPRYPTLPNLLKAKGKPIVEIGLDDLGIEAEELRPRLHTERLIHDRHQRRGEMLQGDLPAAAGRLATILCSGKGSAPGGEGA